jgi:uncharacterized protein YyaL (SSP411 family)
MARESFEDQEVAALMNDGFVCIKVDREERPEIDQIYMAIALEMAGRGGWPLTIIMTPEKKPFFAATYIPKRGRYGHAGMMEIIPRIRELWTGHREELLQSAEEILDRLRPHTDRAAPEQLDARALDRGYEGLAAAYDAQHGGFGTAPKFPAPHNLLFLLRCWRRSGDASALEMVEETLQAMRMGGIYDQVGSGLHRYSTDEEWLVPHFEKMLYDQALLCMACTEAYQATGKDQYAVMVREILEYVLRDLTAPAGGFYSAEDADSDGEEGKFYLWTAQELQSCLDKEELWLAIRLFDIHEQGNFHGKNILRLRSSPADAAAVLKIPEQDLQDRLEMIRRKLSASRERRIRPLRDELILADWNGLMIAALSRAAQALQEPGYARAAERAAGFILENMVTPEGRLMHRYLDGAAVVANLDDYAFLVWGLIDLYETVFDIRYLKKALDLSQMMLQHFWDGLQGGLFFTPDDGESLPLRQKVFYDGAVPSGNSAAMLNMLRLSRLTGRAELEEKAEAAGRALLAAFGSHSSGQAMFLCALDFALGPSTEVALVGDPADEGIKQMLRAIRSRFLPNSVVLLVSDDGIRQMADFTKDMVQLDGLATAYVCSGHRCLLPAARVERLVDMLERPAGE